MGEGLVCGVGINDADYKVTSYVEGKQKMCKFYRTWKSMIERCYSNTYQNKYPTYKGCYVSDEWLRFMEFKQWMVAQDWQGKVLDKDILRKGNKVYSPQTCVFVRAEVNSLLLKSEGENTEYPMGVHFSKKSKKFTAQCGGGHSGSKRYIGLFDCPDEAHLAWKAHKHRLACRYADEESDPRVSDALRNWYID